jgi:TetR/AcrR family transcriptional regulator
MVARVSPRAAARGRPRAPEVPATAPTREVILDAAERLFAARGVDGVAVRDLARELNLTPSSLYNHFPGKQALYEAVLERGLRPIVELLAAEQQQSEVNRESVARVVSVLVRHMADHPHLARLLERALLEETGSVQALIARWLAPLYRGAAAVVDKLAPESGWEPDEVPHVAIGLFGLVLSYFIYAEPLRRLAAWSGDAMSPRELAAQGRFLERAILRMLSPRLGERSRRRSAHG